MKVITPDNHSDYKDKIVKKTTTVKVNTCSHCEVSGNVCHHFTIILPLGWVSVARFFYQQVVNNARPKHIQILWALKWKLIHWDIFYICDFVVVENFHIPCVKDLFELPSPRETLNLSDSYFGFRNVGFCHPLSGCWDFCCLWNGLLSVIKRQLAAVIVQSFTPIGSC